VENYEFRKLRALFDKCKCNNKIIKALYIVFVYTTVPIQILMLGTVTWIDERWNVRDVKRFYNAKRKETNSK
jgi:hypothetical protein